MYAARSNDIAALATTLTLSVLLCAATVLLVGWGIGNELAIAPAPYMPGVAPQTAACFLAISLAFLPQRKWQYGALAIIGLVFVLNLYNLIPAAWLPEQEIPGFRRKPALTGSQYQHFMSLPTSWAFLVLCAGSVLVVMRYRLASLAALFGLSCALAFLCLTAMDLHPEHWFGAFKGLSIYTAVLFVFAFGATTLLSASSELDQRILQD